MFKTAIIALSLSLAGVAAIAIGSEGASAGNGKLVDIASRGVVNCAAQTWPNIEPYCLRSVSEGGEVRMARVVNF